MSNETPKRVPLFFSSHSGLVKGKGVCMWMCVSFGILKGKWHQKWALCHPSSCWCGRLFDLNRKCFFPRMDPRTKQQGVVLCHRLTATINTPGPHCFSTISVYWRQPVVVQTCPSQWSLRVYWTSKRSHDSSSPPLSFSRTLFLWVSDLFLSPPPWKNFEWNICTRIKSLAIESSTRLGGSETMHIFARVEWQGDWPSYPKPPFLLHIRTGKTQTDLPTLL